MAGFGRWRLPADMFLNFVLPIPSYDEQVMIAEKIAEECGVIDSIIQGAY